MMDSKHAGMLALVLSLVVFFIVAVVALTAGRNTYGTVSVKPGGPYLTLGPSLGAAAATTATISRTSTAAAPQTSVAAPPNPAPAPPNPTPAPPAPSFTAGALTPLPASDFHLEENEMDSGMMMTL